MKLCQKSDSVSKGKMCAIAQYRDYGQIKRADHHVMIHPL